MPPKKTVILLQQAYLKDNPVCQRCGNEKHASYDHIIPQYLLKCLNINPQKEFWEENSQTLCYACNHLKSGQLDLANPKTKPLLKELVDKL